MASISPVGSCMAPVAPSCWRAGGGRGSAPPRLGHLLPPPATEQDTATFFYSSQKHLLSSYYVSSLSSSPRLHSQPSDCSLGLEEEAGYPGVSISSPEIKVICNWGSHRGRAGLGTRGPQRGHGAVRPSFPAREPDERFPILSARKTPCGCCGKSRQGTGTRAGR